MTITPEKLDEIERLAEEVKMSNKVKIPGSRLTVVIRDDTPLIFCGDSPSYRSVTVELTQEQRAQIALRYRGASGATEIFEEISKCFIEPEEQQS